MTETMVPATIPATTQTTDEKRGLALLKAVGLDRVSPEQRELALAIADRYELDLMLKHLVLIDGRAYITRDGLLHVAHRSGLFDGIEVDQPVLDGDHWRSKATVYRKDMARGFTYHGRYPKAGGNAKYAPEMAVKVAEVAALRRAFDVSAPTVEEQWEGVTLPAPEAVTVKPTLAELARQKAETVQEPEPTEPVEEGVVRPVDETPEPLAAATGVCAEGSPYGDGSTCAKPAGHKGNHANEARESW